MSKVKKITINEVDCPKCGKKIRTEKDKDIQCRDCGKRFDLE